jgi:hypothetical protein
MIHLVVLTAAAMVVFLVLLLPANYILSFLLTREPSEVFFGVKPVLEEPVTGSPSTSILQEFPRDRTTALAPFYSIAANAAATAPRLEIGATTKWKRGFQLTTPHSSLFVRV